MKFSLQDILYCEFFLETEPNKTFIQNEDFLKWDDYFRFYKNSYDFDMCYRVLSRGKQKFKNSDFHQWLIFREIEFLIQQHKYEYSLSLLKQLNDTKFTLLNAKISTRIGDIERITGQYKDAIDKYNESNSLIETTENNALFLYNLHMIGVTYWANGEFNNALSYYMNVIGNYRKLFLSWDESSEMDRDYISNKDDILRNMANVLRDIGMLYRRIGEYQKAIISLNNSLDYQEKIKNDFEITHTLIQKAKIYRDKNDWKNCRETNFKALQISQIVGDKYQQTAIMYRLSEMFYFQQDFQNSLSWAERAISYSETYDLNFYLSRSYLILSFINYKKRNISNGNIFLENAINNANIFNKTHVTLIIDQFHKLDCNLSIKQKNNILRKIGAIND